MDYIRTRHSVYLLTDHMIFVTNYRRPVISEEIGDFMKATAKRLCVGYGGELLSAETDSDHIHMLVSLPPTCDVSLVVRSLKTQLSKETHQIPEYNQFVQKYLPEGTPLWSPTYFVATAGSISPETMKSYIEEQKTDENKRKYERRSKYWEGKGKSRSEKKDSDDFR